MIYFCYRKSTAMQRIQFSVSRGVTHHATMEIPLGRIEAVVKKMIGRYDLNLSKDQKYKRKLKGVSVADMVVFFDKVEQKYHLFILVTAGETLANFTQQGFDTLNPIESSHLTFPSRYELVRTTRKKSAMQNTGRSHNDPETWTWRMNKAYYEAIQVYLNKAVIVYPKNPTALVQAIHSLENMIGLRGIRQQIGYLWAHTVKHWKHTYKSEIPYTLTLGFMRAVKDDAHSLGELMALHTVKEA
jgi:hypothetical protein